VVLCKTFEAFIGGSGYVLSFYFYALSNEGMVSRTLDYVICVGEGFTSPNVNKNLSSRGSPM
jgi:hypothetical protein